MAIGIVVRSGEQRGTAMMQDSESTLAFKGEVGRYSIIIASKRTRVLESDQAPSSMPPEAPACLIQIMRERRIQISRGLMC